MKEFLRSSKVHVAPLAGAWIEINTVLGVGSLLTVAPLAGAWIEIGTRNGYVFPPNVAPLAGAWIEIHKKVSKRISRYCRSPRGSVD